MRSYDVAPASMDLDAASGWEVAHPLGGTLLDGVRMAGFRDRLAAGLDLHVLPQPAVIVVIGFGDEPLGVDSVPGRRPLNSLVAGLSPGQARIRGRRVECVEVRLSPRAACRVLGVSPRELEGSVTCLADLWGCQERRLRERLGEAGTWRERLALTDEFLAERAADGPSMTAEVTAVWETIVARRGRVRVDDLAASCGWSRKRLRSRFTDQVGLTPKRAAMLVRFDHAARALNSGHSAADVALACGYTDQSHLHRDVFTHAGCTPGTLAGSSTTTPPRPEPRSSP